MSKAKTMYYAVYNFGPRWQPPTITGAGPLAAARAFGAGGAAAFATQPVAIDPQDLRAIMEFVEEENPSLAQLRQLTPQAAQASALVRAARGTPKRKSKKKPKG